MRYTRIDCNDLNKVLCQLGIDAQYKCIPNQREYIYDTFEELLKHGVSCITGPYDEREVGDILKRYYRYENGKYRYRREFQSELLYWYK